MRPPIFVRGFFCPFIFSCSSNLTRCITKPYTICVNRCIWNIIEPSLSHHWASSTEVDKSGLKWIEQQFILSFPQSSVLTFVSVCMSLFVLLSKSPLYYTLSVSSKILSLFLLQLRLWIFFPWLNEAPQLDFSRFQFLQRWSSLDDTKLYKLNFLTFYRVVMACWMIRNMHTNKWQVNTMRVSNIRNYPFYRTCKQVTRNYS